MDYQINLFLRTKKVLISCLLDRCLEASGPYGSGLFEISAMDLYVTLKLGETKSGSAKTLHALRTTADYYGWTEKFESWIGKPVESSGKYVLSRGTSRRGHPQNSGGRRLYISRSPVLTGYPAGLTNAFKVSANTALFDLAELAHFTKGDWQWMESPSHERITKARWAQRYLLVV